MKNKKLTPWVFMTLCGLLVSSGTAVAQRVYLVVDRETGDAEAISSDTVSIDGYTISSPSGLLDTQEWSSLDDQGAAGWTEANPKPTRLSEFTLGSSELTAGEAVGIGQPFVGAAHPTMRIFPLVGRQPAKLERESWSIREQSLANGND